MNIKLEEIACSAKAAFLTMLMPIWSVPLGVYLGEHPDCGIGGAKAGAKLMWSLMAKVPISDIYHSFREGDEALAAKYPHIIDRYTVEPIFDPSTERWYYPNYIARTPLLPRQRF